MTEPASDAIPALHILLADRIERDNLTFHDETWPLATKGETCQLLAALTEARATIPALRNTIERLIEEQKVARTDQSPQDGPVENITDNPKSWIAWKRRAEEWEARVHAQQAALEQIATTDPRWSAGHCVAIARAALQPPTP